MTILAFAARSGRSRNASLIADVARLGYLDAEWETLDATYGLGTFWQQFRPERLHMLDAHPEKGTGDFTHINAADRRYQAVVFDPPYKLNGRPDPAVDARYGVDVPEKWEDRLALIAAGTRECARVCDRMLLVKCMDQVCRYSVRWQTRWVEDIAEECGFGLVDRFDVLGGRAQPGEGKNAKPGKARIQRHARRNASQLLVFRRGHTWRPS